ncbi:MAG TPA: four helix bundle protein [Lacibacter sp.]|nr:four helix bundle protein [Lacibacter sp.]
MKNFKELRIWQKGIDIAVKSYELTSAFPANEKFGITAQMNRAAISIPSNIAEGSSRRTNKDYFRFIEISLGSSFELETQLIIAQKTGLGNSDKINEMMNELSEEQKMLQAFMSKLAD